MTSRRLFELLWWKRERLRLKFLSLGRREEGIELSRKLKRMVKRGELFF